MDPKGYQVRTILAKAERQAPEPEPIIVALEEEEAEIEPEIAETLPQIAEEDGPGIAFLDIKENQCRYPLWGHRATPFECKRYCGEPAHHSYCDYHAGLCGVPNARWPSFLATKPLPRK